MRYILDNLNEDVTPQFIIEIGKRVNKNINEIDSLENHQVFIIGLNISLQMQYTCHSLSVRLYTNIIIMIMTTSIQGLRYSISNLKERILLQMEMEELEECFLQKNC